MIELLLGLLGGFILTEVHVCMPAFARWTVRRQVAKLPAALRERMEEEWLAEVAACPSHVQKVIFALGLFSGRADLLRAHGEQKLPRIHGDLNVTLEGVSATGSVGTVMPAEPGKVPISGGAPTPVVIRASVGIAHVVVPPLTTPLQAGTDTGRRRSTASARLSDSERR